MKTFLIALFVYVAFQTAPFAQSGNKMGVGPIFKNNQEAKRKALVLANQNYKPQKPLKNTLSDADSMAAVLRYLGFEVMLVKDKTLAETQDTIDQFNQSLQAGDVVFVYYSGHGLGYMYDNFLLPINFDAQCARQVPNRAISLRKLTTDIQNRSVRNLLLVVDACRDQGFGEVCPDKSTQSPITHLVPPDKNPNGILQAFATDYGQTATFLSTQNRNSLYTESLLLYLRQPLELQEIFTRAARRTNQESRKLHQLDNKIPIQEPVMSNKIYDNYYFLKPASSPPIPDPKPTDLSSQRSPEEIVIQYPCKLPIDKCVSDSVFFRVTQSAKAQSESAAKAIAIMNAMEEITTSFASFIQSETVKYFKSVNAKKTPEDITTITDSTRIKSSLSLTGFKTVCEKYIDDKATGDVTCYLCGQVQAEYVFMELGKLVKNKKSKFNGKIYEEYLLEVYKKANK